MDGREKDKTLSKDISVTADTIVMAYYAGRINWGIKPNQMSSSQNRMDAAKPHPALLKSFGEEEEKENGDNKAKF